MRTVIDEFTLTYPGIKNVEREYFNAVHIDMGHDLLQRFAVATAPPSA